MIILMLYMTFLNQSKKQKNMKLNKTCTNKTKECEKYYFLAQNQWPIMLILNYLIVVNTFDVI
jgi:hypothetical protein